MPEPGRDAAPVAGRDRCEQPLAAGDAPSDQAEAVDDVERLASTGAQEVLVGDDDGAAGAQPRPEPVVEAQAGGVVQHDGVGMDDRRLGPERQAEVGQGRCDRRMDRAAGKHRRCERDHLEADVRGERADLRGDCAASPARKARVDKKRDLSPHPDLRVLHVREPDDAGGIARRRHQ